MPISVGLNCGDRAFDHGEVVATEAVGFAAVATITGELGEHAEQVADAMLQAGMRVVEDLNLVFDGCCAVSPVGSDGRLLRLELKLDTLPLCDDPSWPNPGYILTPAEPDIILETELDGPTSRTLELVPSY